MECCGKELRSDLFRNTGGEYDRYTEDELLAEIKKLAGKAQNPLVSRMVLVSMSQGKNEGICAYKTRLSFNSRRKPIMLTENRSKGFRNVPTVDVRVTAEKRTNRENTAKHS